MAILNPTFRALLKEVEFTKEILGAGTTQIRMADYSKKGIYFLAFTGISAGLERLGKLCLLLDYYINNNGAFPDQKFLRNEIGHDIEMLYQKSLGLHTKYSIQFEFLPDLADPILQSILQILSNFAKGDRYSNFNFLVGDKHQSDPIGSWFNLIDVPIFEGLISNRKKAKIRRNAAIVSSMLEGKAIILHASEDGEELTDFGYASFRTGLQEAVAPFRQLFILQIIRYWVEIISCLEYQARALGRNEIPFFGEVFAPFYNPDFMLKKYKQWDRF